MKRRMAALDGEDRAALAGDKVAIRARRPREFTDNEYDKVSLSNREKTEAVVRFSTRYWNSGKDLSMAATKLNRTNWSEDLVSYVH